MRRSGRQPPTLDGRTQQTNLDGRSGKDNRALVDMGNQPIVSFNEDYENGVLVRGNLTTTGPIQPHGGDCTGVRSRLSAAGRALTML
jgi:hypothetical protein